MKKFSQQAAANVVPLLARILIFLAFVPTGWHHAMQQTVFTGDAAVRLREIGVVSADSGLGSMAYVAYHQDAPPLTAPPADGGGVQTRALHQLTLYFDSLRLPKPTIWAWAVTVFELIGGSLVLSACSRASGRAASSSGRSRSSSRPRRSPARSERSGRPPTRQPPFPARWP